MNFPIGWTEVNDGKTKTRRSSEDRSDAQCVSKADRAPEEESLRDMRDGSEAVDATPQGSQLAEQRTAEHSDPLFYLSHLLASCEGRNRAESYRAAMQILSAPDAQALCLQHLSDTDKAEWATLSRDDKAETLIEAAIAVHLLMDRTKRLKALGNAVVPQCAQWIGERIMTADAQPESRETMG
jgi:site-specific DNA-cytosine methylase